MVERVERRGRERVDVGVLRDVAVHRETALPETFDLRHDRGGALVVHVADHDVGATPGELERGRAPDAAGAAGDDGDRALDVHGVSSGARPRSASGAVERLRERRVVRAPPEVVAAVDPDRLAGDPRRLGPGEEAHERGDVLGLADAADRHLGEVVVEDRVRGHDAGDQLGRHQSRLHRVDAHLRRTELVGRHSHEHVDAGLPDAVRAEVAVGRRPRDRRHADERSPATARHHRRGVLEREERADDVHVDGRPPLLERAARDRTHVHRAAGARHRDLQRAGPLGGCSYCRLHLVLVRDVGHDPPGAELRRGLLEARLRPSADRDRGPVGDQRRRGRSPMPLPPPVTSAPYPSSAPIVFLPLF